MLNNERVLEIMRATAVQRGWPILGRIVVHRRKSWLFFGTYQWHVLTNADARGGNVRLVIDDMTGGVVSAGLAPK